MHANLSDPLSTGPGIMGGRVDVSPRSITQLGIVDEENLNKADNWGEYPFTAPSLSRWPSPSATATTATLPRRTTWKICSTKGRRSGRMATRRSANQLDEH